MWFSYVFLLKWVAVNRPQTTWWILTEANRLLAGYRVTILGHSLGAGVGAFLTLILRPHISNLCRQAKTKTQPKLCQSPCHPCMVHLPTFGYIWLILEVNVGEYTIPSSIAFYPERWNVIVKPGVINNPLQLEGLEGLDTPPLLKRRL